MFRVQGLGGLREGLSQMFSGAGSNRGGGGGGGGFPERSGKELSSQAVVQFAFLPVASP